MTDLVVHPAGAPLVGSVPVPGDDAIAARALLLAALCNGKSRLRDAPARAGSASMRAALLAMGVEIEERAGETIVTGAGLFGLREPSRALDCAASETTLRLLCGVLAGQTFASTLSGAATRPTTDLLAPLRARGARVDVHAAPIHFDALAEDEHLAALACDLPAADSRALASATKGALLLSGLYAHGTTALREPMLTPDHAERLLLALGVPLRTLATVVELDAAGWSGSMPAFDARVPGDPSAAAFVVGAALMVPGSRVTVRRVGTNPTATGFFDALREMHAPVALEPDADESGEPIATVRVENASALASAKIGSEIAWRSADELAVLAAIAARAPGETTTTIRAGESGALSRSAVTADVLRAFGVECELLADGLLVAGRAGGLRAARVDSLGDARVAMAAVLLGLAGDAPSRVDGADCIGELFPRFVGTLRALGARIDVA